MQLSDLYEVLDAGKLQLPEHVFRLDQVIHEQLSQATLGVRGGSTSPKTQ